VFGGPVLPDAPIVIVHAAAWFDINLFIILLVQCANKMGSQQQQKFLNCSDRIADGLSLKSGVIATIYDKYTYPR
jgi:hypothetical protein